MPAFSKHSRIRSASASPSAPGVSIRPSSTTFASAESPMFFHASTAARQCRSTSSSAEGMIPAAVTALTAAPASTTESKYPATVRSRGREGRSRTVISVMTPSVPSEPTISPARSYPATPLAVLRPTRTSSPRPLTISSSRT